MEELVKFMAQKLVDEPEQVNVAIAEEDDGIIRITLTVAPGDVGKVIGKQGRIAKAMRTVVRAASTNTGKRYMLDIA